MGQTRHQFRDFALQMTRGNEVEIEITTTRTVSGVTTAQSLATGTLRLTAKESLADDVPLFELTTGNGIVTVDAEAGTARATLPTTVTADLPDQEVNLYVELAYVDAFSKPHTFQTGRLAVFPGAA